MTDRPLAADRTELAIDVEAPQGPETPPLLFGLAAEYPNGGLPRLFDSDVRTADHQTPDGRRILAQVADELDAARNWPQPPTVLIVNRRDPAPWRRAAPAEPTVEEAAVAEAVRQLDLAPVPAGRTQVEREAAARAAGSVGSARRAALERFAVAGDAGLTDDELAELLDAVPNRIATRRKELQDDGLLEATGKQRPTRSGADANIHRITDLGRSVWGQL